MCIRDSARSEGLINYLARERHGSPFEHTSMTFFISAPIFVFREFMRHRIASYNEESGRYRELRPNFYVPAKERKLVQIGKAGSYTFIDGTDEQYEITVAAIKESCTVAYESYKKMLDAGGKNVAKNLRVIPAEKNRGWRDAVSYTHLTLPTKRIV